MHCAGCGDVLWQFQVKVIANAQIALGQRGIKRTPPEPDCGHGYGLAVHRHFDSDLPPLDQQTELVLYRVAQESLTNVARHAEASRVWLSLQPGRDSVVLRVVDDGRGMNGRALNGGGLRGMRERAVLVGAALAVKPARSGGVEVRLEVPTETR